MNLHQAIIIVMLGYESVDAGAKETWVMLRLFDDLPLTSGNLGHFAKIRGRHAETLRRQLKILRKAGLVKRRRQGDLIIYAAIDPSQSDQDFQDVQKALAFFCRKNQNNIGVDGSPPPLSFRREGEGVENKTTSTSTSIRFGKKADEWKSQDFLHLASDLYRKTYGHVSLDLEQDVHGERRQGVIVVRIKKSLVQRFQRLDLTNQDVIDYIEWLFDTKAANLDINVGVICSRALQSEWLSARQAKVKDLAGKREVTHRKLRECPFADKAGVPNADAWRFFDDEDHVCQTCPRRMRCSESKEG